MESYIISELQDIFDGDNRHTRVEMIVYLINIYKYSRFFFV